MSETSNRVITPQLPHPYSGKNEARKKAMEFICNGEVEKGRDALEALFRQSDLWAGNTLAYGYQCGWFGSINHERAVILYRNLILMGNQAAPNNLAFCYQEGLGVKKNIHWAIYWYKKGVEAGDDYAMTNLANIYITGSKKYRNFQVGIELCKQAPKDCAEAYNLLGICNEYGLGMPKNLKKAKELYQKALELEDNDVYKKNLERVK